MPQWRKLHVKATESLDIHEMPDDFTRLLWVMLPLALDQHGRGIDSTAWVKAKAMPLRDDIDGTAVEGALTWYADRGMIERYRVNGRRYFWIPTWYSHQGNTKREADSIYPAPPSWVAPEWVQDNGGNAPDNAPSNSRSTQEPVVSKSSSDVDVDVDTDVESDTEAEPEPPKTAAAQAPAPAPPTPKPRRKSQKKPQKPIPPAVQVFRENAHRYPAKSWYDDVAQAVGDNPGDLELWGQVVKNYVGLGWNPTNVSNMLEFYRRREIPSNDGGKSNANSLRDRPADFIGSATTAHDHNDPTPEEIAEFQAAVDAHARQRRGQAAGAVPG